MNNINLSKDQMDNLLKVASQKLGQNENDLKSSLENGDLGKVIGNLDAKTQSKISALTKDPKALEALMQNNNVKNLIAGLMGGQK